MLPGFSDELKKKRTALGLDDDRAAEVLTLSSMSYFDLEFHDDEWFTVVPFYKVRFLCLWLDIDLLKYIESTSGMATPPRTEANKLIRARREELNLSPEQFADRCGFYPAFTAVVESGDGLLTYPFRAISEMCEVLQLDQKSFAQTALLSAL